MIRSRYGRLAALSLALAAACAGEPVPESGSGDDVASETSIRACDLVPLDAATRVLGPGTEHPGGDTEELTCLYSRPGVGMLTVQLSGAEYYDQVSILPPHSAVEIGARGRSSVQENGATAVQFVAGDHSVTLSVQPIGGSGADYLEPLVTAAREAAGRLP